LRLYSKASPISGRRDVPSCGDPDGGHRCGKGYVAAPTPGFRPGNTLTVGPSVTWHTRDDAYGQALRASGTAHQLIPWSAAVAVADGRIRIALFGPEAGNRGWVALERVVVGCVLHDVAAFDAAVGSAVAELLPNEWVSVSLDLFINAAVPRPGPDERIRVAAFGSMDSLGRRPLLLRLGRWRHCGHGLPSRRSHPADRRSRQRFPAHRPVRVRPDPAGRTRFGGEQPPWPGTSKP
jgi:hypothetical protein